MPPRSDSSSGSRAYSPDRKARHTCRFFAPTGRTSIARGAAQRNPWNTGIPNLIKPRRGGRTWFSIPWRLGQELTRFVIDIDDLNHPHLHAGAVYDKAE